MDVILTNDLVQSLWGEAFVLPNGGSECTEIQVEMERLLEDLPPADPMGDKTLPYLLRGDPWQKMADDLGWHSYANQVAPSQRTGWATLRTALAPIRDKMVDRNQLTVDRKTYTFTDVALMLDASKPRLRRKLKRMNGDYDAHSPYLVDYLLMQGLEKGRECVNAIRTANISQQGLQIMKLLVVKTSSQVQEELDMERNVYGHILHQHIAAPLGLTIESDTRIYDVMDWPSVLMLRAVLYDREVPEDWADEFALFSAIRSGIQEAVERR